MTVAAGKIKPFDPSYGEEWTHYIECLECYFLANGIEAAENKQAMLINVIWPQAYKLGTPENMEYRIAE